MARVLSWSCQPDCLTEREKSHLFDGSGVGEEDYTCNPGHKKWIKLLHEAGRGGTDCVVCVSVCVRVCFFQAYLISVKL